MASIKEPSALTSHGIPWAGMPQELFRKRQERRQTVVRLHPVGMKKGVKVLSPQEHKVNYFIGNDPKKWRTGIPTQALFYKNAYAGVDLKF